MHTDQWDFKVLRNNPVFGPLCATFGLKRFGRWPDCNNFNNWLSIAAHSGELPVRFVPDTKASDSLSYEETITQHRLVPTRPGWHDFFNAMTWALFPRTKAAIYAAHARLRTTDGAHRGRQRDALTLFDECGVIIATTNERYKRCHRAHDWQNLFVTHRSQWWHELSAVMFGHGLYQQCLTPYIGLTGKALYVSVEPDWFRMGYTEACLSLDKELAEWLGVLLRSPAQLLPLPVLGVPTWHADNVDPAFYKNKSYFRPARKSDD